MGINAKLRRDINSPDFSTCLLLIQLVWVAVDLTSYHSLNSVDIKSHNRMKCGTRTSSNIRRSGISSFSAHLGLLCSGPPLFYPLTPLFERVPQVS